MTPVAKTTKINATLNPTLTAAEFTIKHTYYCLSLQWKIVHLYSNNSMCVYSPIQVPSLLSGIKGVADAVVKKGFSFIWQRLPVHCDGQLEKDREKHHNSRNTRTLNGRDNS